MKKYLILISTVFIFLITSCEDYIAVTPENSVTYQSYFKTEEDFENFMQGIRLSFNEVETFNTVALVMRGQLYDECDASYQRWCSFHKSMYNGDRGEFSWVSFYNVISRCNTLIDFAKKSDMDADRANFYLGQAHFYLAYNYFLIARFWGDAPIIKKHAEIGMKGKSTVKEVLDYALENAAKAIEILPEIDKLKDASGNRFKCKNVPSKQASRALYADLLMWHDAILKETSNLQSAIDTLSLVINDPEFSLASTPESLIKAMESGNSSESIIELNIIAAEKTGQNGYYTYQDFVTYPLNPNHQMGDIKHKPRMQLKNTTVRAYFDDNDLRRDAYFYKFEEMEQLDEMITGGFAYPYKFRKLDFVDQGYNYLFNLIDVNAVLYRLSGLILLRAEAYAKLGQNDLAIADLNRIRTRSNVDAYTNSEGSDIQYLVFKEREKELLWERKRYFDVIRNGYWATEFKGAFKYLSEQDIEDGALYYPNFWGAFEQNSKMTQNTYWLRKFN